MVTRLILLEASLLLVAWLLAWMMNLPLRPLWHMDAVGVGIGWTSTLLPAALFFWMIQSSWEPFAALRRLVQEQLMPLLGEVTFFQIILLSARAGPAQPQLHRPVTALPEKGSGSLEVTGGFVQHAGPSGGVQFKVVGG